MDKDEFGRPILDAPFVAFDESQPRDESGKWTDTGGGSSIPVARLTNYTEYEDHTNKVYGDLRAEATDPANFERFKPIGQYTADKYQEVNKTLLGKTSGLGEFSKQTAAKIIPAMDKYIEEHPIREPVKLYRAITLDPGSLDAGQEFSHKTFGSFTASEDFAQRWVVGGAGASAIYGNREKWVFEVDAQKGDPFAPALRMESENKDMGDEIVKVERIKGFNAEEGEFTMARDTKLRVVSVETKEYELHGRKYPIKFAKVEIVRGEPKAVKASQEEEPASTSEHSSNSRFVAEPDEIEIHVKTVKASWSPPALDPPFSFEAFDPDQPRDEAGRWTDGGGGVVEDYVPMSAPSETPERAAKREELHKAFLEANIKQANLDEETNKLRAEMGKIGDEHPDDTGYNDDEGRRSFTDPEVDKRYGELHAQKKALMAKWNEAWEDRSAKLKEYRAFDIPEELKAVRGPENKTIKVEDWEQKTGKNYTTLLKETADKNYARAILKTPRGEITVLASHEFLEDNSIETVQAHINANPDLWENVSRLELHPTEAEYKRDLDGDKGFVEVMTAGGHWDSSDKTIRLFGTRMMNDEVLSHEAGHAKFSEIEHGENVLDWDMRRLKDSPEERAKLEKAVAENEASWTKARKELDEGVGKKLSSTDEQYREAKRKKYDIQDAGWRLSSYYKPEEDPEYQAAVKEEKRLKMNVTRLSNQYTKQSKAIYEKHNTNELYERWDKGYRSPLQDKLRDFKSAVKTEGGSTDYSRKWAKAGSYSRYTEEYAEVSAIMRGHMGPKKKDEFIRDHPLTHKSYTELDETWNTEKGRVKR